MAQQRVSEAATEKKIGRLEDEVREQQVETQTENVLTNVPPQGEHSEALGTRLRGKKDARLVIDRIGADTVISLPDGPALFEGAEGAAALARKFRGVGSAG